MDSWVEGALYPHCLLALDTLAGIPHAFLFPRLYNPLESHLYWVDGKMKKETQEARRRGIPFEERHEVIRLKDQDDPPQFSSGE